VCQVATGPSYGRRQTGGKLQLAHRGTLILDEVGEREPGHAGAVPAIPRNRGIQSVGSHRALGWPTCAIAAINRNLAERVSAGDLREDVPVLID
jgi:transcriptional regulator with GAF, ATPase, and Fis domain